MYPYVCVGVCEGVWRCVRMCESVSVWACAWGLSNVYFDSNFVSHFWHTKRRGGEGRGVSSCKYFFNMTYNSILCTCLIRYIFLNPAHPLVLHTLLILVQATTLNVAINSHSTVLLTIMMSNNFVELKGSVFKKFETNNLFQMSCAGV